MFFLFPVVTCPTWTQRTLQEFQNLFFWVFHKFENCSPSYLGFSFPLNVPNQCVWKPPHHPGCQVSFTPAHTHVLLHLLSNLSFLDICFISTITPKMLNIWTKSKAITYAGYISQMYFFISFGILDDFLLSVMACHKYEVISHSLHYTVNMNPRHCGLLVLLSCIMNTLYSLFQSLMVLQLYFYTDLEILQFVCELNQMLQIACSDTFLITW